MTVKNTISGTPSGEPAIKDSGNGLENILNVSTVNTLPGGVNDIQARNDRNIPRAESSSVPGKYTINFYEADEISLAAKMEVIEFVMIMYEGRDQKERLRSLFIQQAVMHMLSVSASFYMRKVQPSRG